MIRSTVSPSHVDGSTAACIIPLMSSNICSLSETVCCNVSIVISFGCNWFRNSSRLSRSLLFTLLSCCFQCVIRLLPGSVQLLLQCHMLRQCTLSCFIYFMKSSLQIIFFLLNILNPLLSSFVKLGEFRVEIGILLFPLFYFLIQLLSSFSELFRELLSSGICFKVQFLKMLQSHFRRSSRLLLFQKFHIQRFNSLPQLLHLLRFATFRLRRLKIPKSFELRLEEFVLQF
ncbi:protein GRIP-like [Pyrus ussuriensis x Pyrus communis]|uniref:Protein GRIP-like n=1 Tax=Pyrus ussuriensis x Pyrus communis TaxID=2448454 RepID=A0A5N5HJR3_9ROSA|nr:protein GRIP-like [Pyrus ussuriensis x Pyrus communis]